MTCGTSIAPFIPNLISILIVMMMMIIIIINDTCYLTFCGVKYQSCSCDVRCGSRFLDESAACVSLAVLRTHYVVQLFGWLI